jgi:hypothetical protein
LGFGDVAFLSICAIVKNEADYIYEWLSYHYAIGVERFTIFHNASTDDTLAVIKSWDQFGLVDVIEWPYPAPQIGAYREMLANYRHVSEWCAFIDVDEFLCPKGPRTLPALLRALPEDCGGLYVHWMCFGSSGHVAKPDGLVTETYTRRGYNDFDPNRIGKTIVRLRDATDVISPHLIGSRLRILNDSLDEVRQDANAGQETVSHEQVALHHYFTKSLDEWRKRRALGRPALHPSSPEFIRSEDQFRSHDVNNVVDEDAARIMQYARVLSYRSQGEP